MNDAPRVADATSGIFRRVKVIEVPPLPPGERDVALKDRISREGPGILNWALDGLKRLQIRGRFDVPECVVAATEGFQLDNDVSKLFVEDECFTGADFTTKAGLLYAAYKLWHERCGYRYPNNTTKMAAEWKRLGFEPTRRTDGTYYKGVGLKAQD